jgi:hypothetical protein
MLLGLCNGTGLANLAAEVSLMDKNKNARGQQNQGQQGQGSKDRNWNDTSQSNTNREPAEGGRGQNTGNRGNPGRPERGTGSQGERNSSGISNRGMDRSEEQADLPSRGSSDDDEDWSDRSER